VQISETTRATIELEDRVGAHNYHPLPVVLAGGEGAWVWDADGTRYLDLLAAYSALNFGHRHPRLVAAATAQLDRLTLTSRAFHNDQLGPFCAELGELVGMEAVLPMNSGAEAVETAIKLARKWGYRVKGVPADQASIVVFDGNFHGRTTTIISFSGDPEARDDYGPYTPGFRSVPYGDLEALTAAVDATTVAVLVEPIQGESGVVVPPPGFLAGVRALCARENVLFVADEIQSGLGRAGTTLACDHDQVRPDVVTLGKALGGGIVPLSAVATSRAIMDVIEPGTHGSTFGGNPLAAAVGREVVAMLATGEWQQRATELGAQMHEGLRALDPTKVSEVRGRGLWAGLDLAEGMPPARRVCEELLGLGVLAKDTHATTVRLAPPLCITETEVERVLEVFAKALAAF
jgi:ornithine--oxo-acid transaminase